MVTTSNIAVSDLSLFQCHPDNKERTTPHERALFLVMSLQRSLSRFSSSSAAPLSRSSPLLVSTYPPLPLFLSPPASLPLPPNEPNVVLVHRADPMIGGYAACPTALNLRFTFHAHNVCAYNFQEVHTSTLKTYISVGLRWRQTRTRVAFFSM